MIQVPSDDDSISIDYLEFYVGDAQLAAYFYRTAYGFQPLKYAGPEVGAGDRISLMLGSGSIPTE